MVGNVYCGRVVRVLPGMQAAFVEIGLHRTGFFMSTMLCREVQIPCTMIQVEVGEKNNSGQGSRTQPLANIADVLKQGARDLGSSSKEPIGTKGARLTRHVTLPGRHIVYMPLFKHLGVSHRIEAEEEENDCARFSSLAW